MSNKYLIEEINDLSQWQRNVEDSPQYTMFLSSIYLKSFGGKYKLFFVNKGIEFKAAFCILLSDDECNVILDDLVIYSGILFRNDVTQKEVKARSERFEVMELIIDFLTSKYERIEMALSPQVEDMRPFLWHNYGSKNQSDIFTLHLRYTSYIDISELKQFDNEEDTDLFKNLDTLRQRNIRKARKENSYTVEELNIELFLQFYKELMHKQNENVSNEKLNNMRTVINNCVESKNAVMLATKNGKNEIIYLTVFSYDKYRAYYLFGAGNSNATENYKGTICFWDGFINLAKNYNIKIVDMEGVNSPSRGWFKLSFGGKLLSYYEIVKGKNG